MKNIIYMDYDALRREVHKQAINQRFRNMTTSLQDNKNFIDIINHINDFNGRVIIVYKKYLEYETPISDYFENIMDLEYLEIEKESDKIELLINNENSILIDDYDKYHKMENFNKIKNKILLMNRRWNEKNAENYIYLFELNDNRNYILDIETKAIIEFCDFLKNS